MELPGYQIQSRLGKGGMATVYRAVQESFDREVALKVVDLNRLVDPTFKERFIREKKIIAQLSHPNIVAVYDAGVHDHYLYMAMELLEGDLKKRARHALNAGEALDITEQVARGLAYAHEQGYIHRDVKPDNILFRHDGTAILTDFGIARSQYSRTRLTKVGVVAGTPKYMSPEQARGRALEAASDIYSLGVVLYELLTGRVPFYAEDSIALGIMHLQDPVPPLPKPLAALQPLMDQMLAKEPRQRFHNAHDLIAEIELLREQLPLEEMSARSTRVRVDIPRHERRPKGIRKPHLVFGSAIGAALAAGVAFAVVAMKEVPEPQAEEIPKVLSESKQQQVDSLLLKAAAALESGRLVFPEGASALSLYRSVLTHDPSSQPAREGMKQLHVQLLQRANRLVENNDLVSAKRALLDMMTAGVAPREVNDMRARINERLRLVDAEHLENLGVRERLRLNGLLVNAQIDIEDGRLVEPQGNNALERYRTVLQMDTSNREARQGIFEVATLLLHRVEQAVDERDFITAELTMNVAEEIAPEHPQLQSVRNRLDQLRDVFKG